MRTSLSREDGIVMPVALMAIVSVTLLMITVGANAGWSHNQSRRDTRSQQALDAAESGIQKTIGRLNRLNPDVKQCLAGAGVPADPVTRTLPNPVPNYCAVQLLALDNDELAAVRVTSQNAPDDTRNQRTIVSTGMSHCSSLADNSSGCVKHRLVSNVSNVPSVFQSEMAAYANGNLTINNDNYINEGIGSSTPCTPIGPVGGDWNAAPANFCGARVATRGFAWFGGRAGVCGELTMQPGQIYTNLGNTRADCLREPWDSATNTYHGQSSPPYSDPPLTANSRLVRKSNLAEAPGVEARDDVVATSSNCKLTKLFTPALGSGCTSSNPDTITNPQPATTWDPVSKVLVVKGSSNVTLRGGTYFFCYLEVDGPGANLRVQPDTSASGNHTPTVIYIGAPGSSDCPNTPPSTGMPSGVDAQATWGSVVLGGNGSIINASDDPSLLQLNVVGSKSLSSDKVKFGGRAGHMKFIVYAPYSSVEVNGSSGVSRVVGEDLVIGGNWGVEWDDRAAVALTFNPTDFVRSTWYECPSKVAAFDTIADPTTGCNPTA